MDDPEMVEDDELEEVHARVCAAVVGPCLVRFAAFDALDAGPLAAVLDAVAFEGRCQFLREHVAFWGEGRDYTSPVFDSPTWLDVAVAANEMLKTTGDEHHVFLAGISQMFRLDDVTVLRFEMDS